MQWPQVMAVLAHLVVASRGEISEKRVWPREPPGQVCLMVFLCRFRSPQCLSPSYLPLRCMAGGCGRLLRGPESCSLGCAQATQCALCLRRPHCGWCTWGGQDGGGRCLEGGLSGPRDGETGGFGDGVRGAGPCLCSDRGVGAENERGGPHRWSSGKVGARARGAGWEVQRLALQQSLVSSCQG